MVKVNAGSRRWKHNMAECGAKLVSRDHRVDRVETEWRLSDQSDAHSLFRGLFRHLEARREAREEVVRWVLGSMVWYGR